MITAKAGQKMIIPHALKSRVLYIAHSAKFAAHPEEENCTTYYVGIITGPRWYFMHTKQYDVSKHAHLIESNFWKIP